MRQRFFKFFEDGLWYWTDVGTDQKTIVTQESVKDLIECHGLNIHGHMVYRTTEFINTEFGPMKVTLAVVFKGDVIHEVSIKEPFIGIKLIENITHFTLDKEHD